MVVSNEFGQSTIEFLLMFPVMVALVVFLVKVNSAIQVSIVNQQYARGQALFLTYNSPNYPELRLAPSSQSDEVTMGISDNLAEDGYTPDATVVSIVRPARAGELADDERAGAEPGLRGRIRVRNSVTLCTGWDQPLPTDGQFQYCRGDLNE